jgi:hypothetical protein
MLLCYFHWLPYQPGDESLDMETALPTSVAAESDGRGSGIMVFPNPVSDRLRIVIESSTDRSVFLELRDVRGTVVYQDKTQRLLQSGLSSVEVDVSRIAAGTYTLSVIGERATQSENVVIQR